VERRAAGQNARSETVARRLVEIHASDLRHRLAHGLPYLGELLPTDRLAAGITEKQTLGPAALRLPARDPGRERRLELGRGRRPLHLVPALVLLQRPEPREPHAKRAVGEPGEVAEAQPAGLTRAQPAPVPDVEDQVERLG